MTKMLLPKIFALLPGFVVSTIMDVIKPVLALDHEKKIHSRVGLEFYTRKSELERTDLVIYCRNAEPRYAYLHEHLAKHNIPYIYDLDDNFYEIPLDSDLGAYHRRPDRLALLDRYLAGASLVRVYSRPLYERLSRSLSQVVQVVPPLDWSVIQPRPLQAASSPVKIVYVTSRAQDPLADVFTQAVLELLNQYADRVHLTIWGSRPEAFAGLPNVDVLPFDINYDRFMRKFSSSGFDIGLAPLIDDDFHRSKTNNKFREYGACKVAGIYSNVSVYSDVEEGETGILVDNTPADWYRALVRLVEDDALRHRVAESAHLRVREKYSQEAFTSVWQQQIEAVLSQPRKALIQPDLPAAQSTPEIPSQTSKIDYMRASLKSMSLGDLLRKGKLQSRDLWWLFKINTLKRL